MHPTLKTSSKNIFNLALEAKSMSVHMWGVF